MDTEREVPAVAPARRRRRLSFRMKIALAGLAGVAAAWLLPRGGGEAPRPSSTLTPTDRPGVTAIELSLASIPEGVSFQEIDGVRVFLVRSGAAVTAFVGSSTTREDGPLYWCRSSKDFQSRDGEDRYDAGGKAQYGKPLRDLDGVRLLVSAGRVTVFPHTIVRGPAVTTSLPVLDASPCAASERVG